MLIVIGILNFGLFGPLLVGLPESAGLLIFGLGLITIAMILRRILGRTHHEKHDENVRGKV
jgi:hypothetical protein